MQIWLAVSVILAFLGVWFNLPDFELAVICSLILSVGAISTRIKRLGEPIKTLPNTTTIAFWIMGGIFSGMLSMVHNKAPFEILCLLIVWFGTAYIMVELRDVEDYE